MPGCMQCHAICMKEILFHFCSKMHCIFEDVKFHPSANVYEHLVFADGCWQCFDDLTVMLVEGGARLLARFLVSKEVAWYIVAALWDGCQIVGEARMHDVIIRWEGRRQGTKQ